MATFRLSRNPEGPGGRGRLSRRLLAATAILAAAAAAPDAAWGASFSPSELTEIRDFELPPGAQRVLLTSRFNSRGQAIGQDDPESVCAAGQAGSCLAQSLAAVPLAQPVLASAVYGPAESAPSQIDDPDQQRFRSFGSQVKAVKWEYALFLSYITATNARKAFNDAQWPHGVSEGWFGRSTKHVGVDKLSHAFSTYVLSELLYARLKKKTGNAPGIALTAAALASAGMLYSEFWDSIEPDGGWSWEDVAANSMGAGFSLLRNSVPGLDKKLDYRQMLVPDSSIFTVKGGQRHFEQQRHLFALKLAGFKAFEKSPARFLELHLGYYGKDFSYEERDMGLVPKRRIFVGFGINFRELFFKNSKSRVGRAAGEVLDYIQPPYTSFSTHITN